jgi:hypothetical protein
LPAFIFFNPGRRGPSFGKKGSDVFMGKEENKKMGEKAKKEKGEEGKNKFFADMGIDPGTVFFNLCGFSIIRPPCAWTGSS